MGVAEAGAGDLGLAGVQVLVAKEVEVKVAKVAQVASAARVGKGRTHQAQRSTKQSCAAPGSKRVSANGDPNATSRTVRAISGIKATLHHP